MNPFIIGGADKTATSSMVALINASEDAFSLYETDLNSQIPTKYAKRFLDEFPDSRFLFYSRADYADAYREFHNYLISRGYKYKIIGDKLPKHSCTFFEKYRDFKLIYCTRLPAEWLVKVQSTYCVTNDVRPVLFQFLRGLIFAREHSDSLIITTEKFLSENDKVVEKVARHLSIDLNDRMFNWWDTAAINPQPLKSVQNWAAAHHSSKMAPKINDTNVIKYDDKFWQPLHQMYNRLVNDDECDVEFELTMLKKSLGNNKIALSDVIEEFNTVSFDYNEGRLSRAIKKITNVVHRNSNR